MNQKYQKLIRISKTHYIIVDDSEKEDDDWCYFVTTIKPLSISEVEEAIYGYSVEKMANEVIKKEGITTVITTVPSSKAQEVIDEAVEGNNIQKAISIVGI